MGMQRHAKRSHDSPFQFIFTLLKTEITLLVSCVQTFFGWLVVFITGVELSIEKVTFDLTREISQ